MLRLGVLRAAAGGARAPEGGGRRAARARGAQGRGGARGGRAWLQILESKCFNFHFDFAEGKNIGKMSKYGCIIMYFDMFNFILAKFDSGSSKIRQIQRKFPNKIS